MRRLFNGRELRPRTYLPLLTGVLLLGALVLAGCGGSSSSSGSSSSGSSSSSEETTKDPSSSGTREAVLFLYTASSDQYTQEVIKNVEKEEASFGWKIKIVTNEFDQNEENSQVLQEVSVGSKPDAYVWAPNDQTAGLGALRKLAATGVPVVAFGTPPSEEAEEYSKFFIGTNVTEAGENSVEPILAARDQLEESGVQLHSPTGNLVTISWPQSLSFAAQKLEGLENGMKEAGSEAPDWIDKEYAPTTDSPGGFKAMNTAIAKVGSQGIDVVYAYNDGMAEGAIKALKAAGLEPGQNVRVVGGNCFGDFSSMVEGTQFSSLVVGASLEAKMLLGLLSEYFENGEEVEEGSYTPPANPTEEPPLPATLSRSNSIPQPPLIVGKGSPSANKKAIAAQTLWGEPVSKLCGVAEY